MSGQRSAPDAQLQIRLLLARLVVSFERLWPALWPTLAVLGMFCRPVAVRAVAQPAAVAPSAVARGFRWRCWRWTLWRARQTLRLAGRDAGLARLEQDSGVTHQPLRALDDTLPGDFSDPATQRLWALHRQRLITSLERLRLAPPRSDLPRRDPWALRAALLLVLVVALVHGSGRDRRRACSAASPSPAVPPSAACRRPSTCGSRRRPIPAARHW